MKETKDKKEKPKDDVNEKKKGSKNYLFIILLIIFIAGGIGAYDYYKMTLTRVYIEKSGITSPVITLAPLAPGVLESLFVKEGDSVKKDMIIAVVGGVPIKAKTDGVIISVQNTPGQIISTQSFVAKMIDPREFRVVGKVDEDKGLNDIKLGQKVMFTVDAFDKKQYFGVVDSIGETSAAQDIVFSISDKREEKPFEVKVKFDIDEYPELKNGMSAKMWVYK